MSTITRAALLSGTLRPRQALSGVLHQGTYLKGHLHLPVGYDYYSGDYAVIPAVSSQTLPTKDRLMHDDVQIQAIPYWETSNEHGTTIIIGRDIG